MSTAETLPENQLVPAVVVENAVAEVVKTFALKNFKIPKKPANKQIAGSSKMNVPVLMAPTSPYGNISSDPVFRKPLKSILKNANSSPDVSKNLSWAEEVEAETKNESGVLYVSKKPVQYRTSGSPCSTRRPATPPPLVIIQGDQQTISPPTEVDETNSLEYQRTLPDVAELLLLLEPTKFAWLSTGDGKFKVLCKLPTGETRFFKADRLPEIERPRFDFAVMFALLPERFTMNAFFEIDEIRNRNKDGRMVIIVDKRMYHGVVSSRLILTPDDEWIAVPEETIPVRFKGCQEVRIDSRTRVNLQGPARQHFPINLAPVQSWTNPFFDHNRLIIGEHFLRKYLVGMDHLQRDDDHVRCICRLIFRSRDNPPKIWSNKIELKRGEW